MFKKEHPDCIVNNIYPEKVNFLRYTVMLSDFQNAYVSLEEPFSSCTDLYLWFTYINEAHITDGKINILS